MSRFNLREDLMNQVLNDPETLVDKWYTPSPGVAEYFNQTRLPCYKPTPCRSQIKCCAQCRYGKKPDPTNMSSMNVQNQEVVCISRYFLGLDFRQPILAGLRIT